MTELKSIQSSIEKIDDFKVNSNKILDKLTANLVIQMHQDMASQGLLGRSQEDIEALKIAQARLSEVPPPSKAIKQSGNLCQSKLNRICNCGPKGNAHLKTLNCISI